MTTAITYVHTRARTTEHVYDVEVDGAIVAAANNYRAAELVALEVEARDAQKTKAEIMADVVQGIWDEHDATITIEGMELHAPRWGDGLCAASGCTKARTHDDTGFCCQHDAVATGSPCACRARFAEDPCCPCGRPAIFFVQYPDRVYAYCVECYEAQTRQQPPLLAQCAAIIRRCLGRTTGAGGIIEELRRVETALSREGW